MSSPESRALAVDLGTTTIAASLLDAETGRRLAAGGCLNPQRSFGADVVTRLAAAAADSDLLQQMSRLVNAELEQLAIRLMGEAGAAPELLARVAIAGNPAMEHLLLGLPVDSLARIPYRPLFTGSRTVRTRDLGWSLQAEAVLFPLPGGFVGGDTIAFLYGQEVCPSRATPYDSRLFLDLGTNAEIALTAGDLIFATSAAAGPAFEGGNLAFGMTALPGAICGVKCSEGRLSVATIGNSPPKGLCGTGALSAIRELLKAGVIDRAGRLLPPDEISSNLATRLTERDGMLAFVIHRDARGEILITQEDIRQVQLAKAAVRAGIEVLIERAGIQASEIGEIVLTGSFGVELNPDLLQGLGILPDMPAPVRFVTDGVLSGIERSLRDDSPFENLEAMVRRVKVVPLSGNPVFEPLFISSMDF